jgi:hypothetical protein
MVSVRTPNSGTWFVHEDPRWEVASRGKTFRGYGESEYFRSIVYNRCLVRPDTCKMCSTDPLARGNVVFLSRAKGGARVNGDGFGATDPERQQNDGSLVSTRRVGLPFPLRIGDSGRPNFLFETVGRPDYVAPAARDRSTEPGWMAYLLGKIRGNKASLVLFAAPT